MDSDIQAIYDYVTSRGLQAEFRSHENRLVCAASGGAGWMGGPSVWVAKKFGRWYISTWVPRLYEAPSANVLGPAVTAALTELESPRLYEIPDQVRKKFGLRELSPAEVEQWMSDIVEADDEE